ncbi:MAG: hypothetical protein ABFD49_06275 [Armatimonadota bacterium]|nr:hypothetical protein [bacterium]
MVNRGHNRGAAYVLALTTLLVGITLALAMLRSSSGCYIAENTRLKKQAAVDLAEAGVDYAYWQIHYQCRKLPHTADLTLTSGTVHIAATDDGDRETSTMLVTSTGTCGKHSHTIKRVVAGLLPYHYALCVKSSIIEADAIINSNGTGGVRTNGLIWLTNYGNTLSSGAWAADNISAVGTVNPKHPNSPKIAFPEIDESYYYSVASKKYIGDTNVSFPISGLSGGVIYVAGKAYVSGTYTGVYTVVASGDIVVNGSLSAANSSSFMALLSPDEIIVYNNSGYVAALLYSHNSLNTGNIQIYGYPTVYGSASADAFSTEHTAVINHNSGLNIEAMRQLDLPGL